MNKNFITIAVLSAAVLLLAGCPSTPEKDKNGKEKENAVDGDTMFLDSKGYLFSEGVIGDGRITIPDDGELIVPSIGTISVVEETVSDGQEMIVDDIETIVIGEETPIQADNTDEFITIFNGEDLTGWEYNPAIWSVENGCLVGQSPGGIPYDKQDYIYWADGKPGDFVLKLKYRLTGAGSNSGIQIRSEKRPDWDCFGYQADMEEAPNWTGCLFHHTRGAVVKRGFKGMITPEGTDETQQFADPAKLAAKFTTEGEWNEYEISAIGSVITLKINGELMCEVDDQHAEATKKGIIAFQMHPGPPMKVEYKDIEIKILDE
jgi:hypothetical protein